jgi:putative ABC transport system permease protein
LKTLIYEPLHVVASVCAVAGAFALVIFFEAVFAGESKQIVAYLRHSDADVWVMQKGISNMHMATSFIWDWKADKVGEVEGVARVTPILYLNTVMRAGERNWFSFIVGLEEGNPRAGPWTSVEGKNLPGPGEAIVPTVLARLADLKLGDDVSIAGRRFSIVGLSEGTFSMANSIAFVTLSDLAEIMSTFGTMSYFLVDAEPGIDPAVLAERIRSEVEKVNAVPLQEFIDYDWALAMQMGLEIIGLMTVIGGALAVLLIGFTVFSHISRREQELAVMKALGVRNREVLWSVLVQTCWIAMLGFFLAISLVLVAVPLTATFVPQVTLEITLAALARVGLIALVATFVATIVPLRRVMRVDPASAFQA